MILILLSLSAFFLKNAKNFKKMISEELMSITWHPSRWWNFCVSEAEKKETDPIFIDEL